MNAEFLTTQELEWLLPVWSELTRLVQSRDGLSVIAPDKPVAMAAMGTMMSGGYPGGVIALAGEVEPGKNQVVFVDPSVITLPKTN